MAFTASSPIAKQEQRNRTGRAERRPVSTRGARLFVPLALVRHIGFDLSSRNGVEASPPEGEFAV